LQWGDAATVEWLRAVMRRRGPARLCIVTTYCASRRLPIVDALERVVRSVRSESWCEGVRLESLSVFYVQQYLQRRFCGDVAPGSLRRSMPRGGNPLLTVMASDALVRRGAASGSRRR
jgi:hypothetical protein